MGNFTANSETSHSIDTGKGTYIFLIEGSIEVNGEKLNERDALGIWDTNTINTKALTDSEILLIDVPMN